MRGAHEFLPVVARIKSQSVTASATASSDAVDMKYWDEVLFVFNMGDYAAGNNGAVTVKVEASNTSNFASAVDVSGKALTAATFTGSAGDDQVGVIRLMADEMIISGTTYRYARLSVAPANQNLTCGAVALGVRGKYQPGSDYDISSVGEIIA